MMSASLPVNLNRQLQRGSVSQLVLVMQTFCICAAAAY